jgi:hypothetical protein
MAVETVFALGRRKPTLNRALKARKRQIPRETRENPLLQPPLPIRTRNFHSHKALRQWDRGISLHATVSADRNEEFPFTQSRPPVGSRNFRSRNLHFPWDRGISLHTTVSANRIEEFPFTQSRLPVGSRNFRSRKRLRKLEKDVVGGERCPEIHLGLLFFPPYRRRNSSPGCFAGRRSVLWATPRFTVSTACSKKNTRLAGQRRPGAMGRRCGWAGKHLFPVSSGEAVRKTSSSTVPACCVVRGFSFPPRDRTRF